ncbi:hypothetical protein D5S18_23125 [Nocardia panacis]|uniref:Uncharacterized protein n=1 Tax=Nocardia panacis TaxID=2340916 RepID=A0A3A4K2G6_9NOCA|nr:hypothetical protein D5S18_23125 [Nocardia panacis]
MLVKTLGSQLNPLKKPPIPHEATPPAIPDPTPTAAPLNAVPKGPFSGALAAIFANPPPSGLPTRPPKAEV